MCFVCVYEVVLVLGQYLYKFCIVTIQAVVHCDVSRLYISNIRFHCLKCWIHAFYLFICVSTEEGVCISEHLLDTYKNLAADGYLHSSSFYISLLTFEGLDGLFPALILLTERSRPYFGPP